MATETITKITDDIDGTAADETVVFGIDGKSYELDLSKRNAAALRKALDRFVEHARPVRVQAPRRAARMSNRSAHTPNSSLFTTLTKEDKDKVRAFAGFPNARRMGDDKVQAWLDAGRP